jgi:hypothetical protein
MTSLLLQVFLLAPAVLALLLVRKPYINTRLYYAHTEEIVSDLPEYVGHYAAYRGELSWVYLLPVVGFLSQPRPSLLA